MTFFILSVLLLLGTLYINRNQITGLADLKSSLIADIKDIFNKIRGKL